MSVQCGKSSPPNRGQYGGHLNNWLLSETRNFYPIIICFSNQCSIIFLKNIKALISPTHCSFLCPCRLTVGWLCGGEPVVASVFPVYSMYSVGRIACMASCLNGLVILSHSRRPGVGRVDMQCSAAGWGAQSGNLGHVLEWKLNTYPWNVPTKDVTTGTLTLCGGIQ